VISFQRETKAYPHSSYVVAAVDSSITIYFLCLFVPMYFHDNDLELGKLWFFKETGKVCHRICSSKVVPYSLFSTYFLVSKEYSRYSDHTK
jgi:hypothetical protein